MTFVITCKWDEKLFGAHTNEPIQYMKYKQFVLYKKQNCESLNTFFQYLKFENKLHRYTQLRLRIVKDVYYYQHRLFANINNSLEKFLHKCKLRYKKRVLRNNAIFSQNFISLRGRYPYTNENEAVV